MLCTGYCFKSGRFLIENRRRRGDLTRYWYRLEAASLSRRISIERFAGPPGGGRDECRRMCRPQGRRNLIHCPPLSSSPSFHNCQILRIVPLYPVFPLSLSSLSFIPNLTLGQQERQQEIISLVFYLSRLLLFLSPFPSISIILFFFSETWLYFISFTKLFFQPTNKVPIKKFRDLNQGGEIIVYFLIERDLRISSKFSFKYRSIDQTRSCDRANTA